MVGKTQKKIIHYNKRKRIQKLSYKTQKIKVGGKKGPSPEKIKKA